MAKLLVSDAWWQEVEPLLPPAPPRPRGGRPRFPRTGTPWELLPPEMGCGSGMTCWRRLRDWHAAGVWEMLHRVLLQRLADADRLDWSRACLDSCSVPAQKGARKPARVRSIAAARARSATLW